MTGRRVDQGLAGAAAGLLPETVDKELRTRYRQVRAMLHSSGLAATYAFVASKSTNEAGALADAYRNVAMGIRIRLGAVGLLEGDPALAGHRQVFEALGNCEPQQYARASLEVAALVGWLSRLADALHVPEPAQPGNGGGPEPI